jgi:polar amino acid transport system substrate-binding protein
MVFICIYATHTVAFIEASNYVNESIVVAGDNYFPPFEYVDANGVYKGFNIDIIHAIAIEMGLDVNIVPMTWKEATERLESGQVDVVQGITDTEDRRTKFLFSQPHLTTSQVIFIAKDNDFIKTVKDLENRRVAIQESDVVIELLSDIEGIEIQKEENQLHALELLINGEADAYVGNRETGLYSIQKYGHYDQVKLIGSPMNSKKYCIAVRKDNEELIRILDEGLRIIKKNGTYKKIYNKWFGEEFISPLKLFKKYIYIVLIGALALIGISLFNVRMNHMLREQVDSRTRELIQSDLFKEHIINSISDGLITFDTNGVIQSLNKNVMEICMISKNKALGRSIHSVDFLDFVDKNLFREALISGKSYIRQEALIQLNGHSKIMEYNILPINDGTDVIQGITITFNDITIQRQHNEQIKRRDKFESIGRLTANIAHEIRNPLTAIKTYIELIPRKIDNKKFQEQIVQDVPQVIERLNGLITELLEYARPREANKTVFELDRPILEVMSLVEGEIRKNGIKLELDLNKNCCVKMDSQQLKQILINLIINSIEALKNEANPSLKIKMAKSEIGCFIEVTDNGIGIASDDIGVIFEPFFTKKTSGTGLGLSIAQQLAEENSGYLTPDSILGQGTTMRLYLPLYDQSMMEDEHEKSTNY